MVRQIARQDRDAVLVDDCLEDLRNSVNRRGKFRAKATECPAIFRHAPVDSGQMIVTSRNKGLVPELRQMDLAQPSQWVTIRKPDIASRSDKFSHIEFA